ncbi:MAG: adenosylmethionine-8-amino-7-oxononanoate aminotransferase [Pirellula sp.]|nr:adenosylmethionine-8-amino-7-oxononanoate aminotransferase [Pirellula sp.]
MAARLVGSIVDISPSGDLVTDLTHAQLTALGYNTETKVVVDEEFETIGIYGENHEQPEMTLIAILSESSPLRLCLVSDSASMMLGVKKGARVEIR